jgi:hypothetical protein
VHPPADGGQVADRVVRSNQGEEGGQEGVLGFGLAELVAVTPQPTGRGGEPIRRTRPVSVGASKPGILHPGRTEMASIHVNRDRRGTKSAEELRAPPDTAGFPSSQYECVERVEVYRCTALSHHGGQPPNRSVE